MLQLDVQALANHLQETVPLFVSVGLARDLGAVNRNTIRYPSAWVILLGEQASEIRYEYDDAIEQAVTARVAVIMAVRDIADRTGARARENLKPIREAVLISMCRHIPQDADQAFRFSRGQLQSGVDAKGGMFWQDEYTLRFDRRIQIS